MGIVNKRFEKISELFSPGKPLERFYPIFEAWDNFLRTPGTRTQKAPHVRDVVDLKRVMIIVVIALFPCLFMGMYNVGYQIQKFQGAAASFPAALLSGARIVLPILLVTYLVGGFWEVLFAVIRKHEINEGFLVTGILFALTLPPSIPLWQVAVGISFGVVIGKEIFGGTGYNVLNPALTGRAFLFFAYPGYLSGDSVWAAVDGFSRATPLAVLSASGKGGAAVQTLLDAGYTFQNMFWGFIPGSIGETSKAACLLGLFLLLMTRIANWRVVVGCFLGLMTTGLLCMNFQGGQTLTYFSLPAHWHLVMGGFAFGAIFMATDPVSSCATQPGRWIYGFLVGALVMVIRVLNPAYPEGVMLAILFMNIVAPLIDYLVVESHIRRRAKHATAR
ncbi:MAG: NADH:ubiquinone reductase (Na(+)-transporting) subunit B [Candidatus Omnitrophota bacterium]